MRNTTQPYMKHQVRLHARILVETYYEHDSSWLGPSNPNPPIIRITKEVSKETIKASKVKVQRKAPQQVPQKYPKKKCESDIQASIICF